MIADVLICAYRNSPPQAIAAILHAIEAARKTGIQFVDPPTFYGSARLANARNEVLHEASTGPADYFVFIDDDMLPEPEAILRLLSHDVPIVTALCTTRSFPVKLCVRMWDRQRKVFREANRVNDKKLVSGEYAAGAAFFALRRDAFEKLRDHYLSATDWAMDNEEMFNRLHVRREYRDKEQARISDLRRRLYEKKGRVVIFDEITAPNQTKTGEDITFGLRCIQCGIPVSIDASITVGHLGDYPFGQWNYEPLTPEQLEQERLEAEAEEEENAA